MNTHRIQNHNNKLSADMFIHIGKAPDTIYESQFPIRVLVEEIKLNSAPVGLETTIDESKSIDPFEADIIDMRRYPLLEIGGVATYPSHGMDRITFINNYLRANSKATESDDVAVYIYKKVKQ